ncbi:MAG: AAA family ATPase [Verrucomicrobiia bacterium]
MLQKLEICGLRGFANKQELKFAIPNAFPGSGLTLIVGPNNSGKSSIIEALNALTAKDHSPPPFHEGKRNKQADEKIEIKATTTYGSIKCLQTASVGGSHTELQPKPPIQNFPNIYVLPSRRYFAPFFTNSSVNRANYTSYFSENLRGIQTNQFSQRLTHAYLLNHKKFNSLLNEVIDSPLDWIIDQDSHGQHYIKFKKNDYYHNSEGLGDGLISLLFIIDALYDSSPRNVIVIDEPELSLHPPLLKKIAKLFIKFSQDRQIIVSTHSSYFIDLLMFENKGSIARVHLKEGNSTISQLSEGTQSKLVNLFKNQNNPHILGLDAREVFFLDDKVILVEGQDDVIFYPKIADQLSVEIKGNFFGWGVGGVTNMPLIAQLLKELGFQHVVGILDAKNETKLKELNEKFQEFSFFSIPADDIRTKSDKPNQKGLLDVERKNSR